MPVHDEDGRIFWAEVREARLDASPNVADTDVACDTSLLVAPEPAWHGLRRVGRVDAAAKRNSRRGHVYGMDDVLGKNEEPR